MESNSKHQDKANMPHCGIASPAQAPASTPGAAIHGAPPHVQEAADDRPFGHGRVDASAKAWSGANLGSRAYHRYWLNAYRARGTNPQRVLVKSAPGLARASAHMSLLPGGPIRQLFAGRIKGAHKGSKGGGAHKGDLGCVLLCSPLYVELYNNRYNLGPH